MLPTHPKRLSRDELAERRQVWRHAGQRVCFTNGCFELLHRGHVECLQAARREGDLLVVGLNSDASVRALKGPNRPLQPLEDRLVILGALQCVDWIVVFDEASVEPLVQAVNPDVLIKGGDYDRSGVVGADWVEAHGGRVVTTGHVPHVSTSDLEEKIRRGI